MTMSIPRKRFGQHFLQDNAIIQKLVDAIQPNASQCIVEIGPGRGALTFPILEKIQKLIVIELDRDLIPHLKKHHHLIVHEADALTFNFSSLYQNNQLLRLIGNLPYNISTPLLFHLFTFSSMIHDMHFMLQKEVADRLSAHPKEAHYGRLSVMAQYRCTVTTLFDVPPTAFYPPPKVNSSVVRILPHRELPHPAENETLFSEVVSAAFNQRRKTLRNSLKNFIDDEKWKTLRIHSTSRAEELSVADYVYLTREISDVNLCHR